MKKKKMVKRFWQNSKSSIIIVVSAAILVEFVAHARYWYTRQLVKEGVEQWAISELRVKDQEHPAIDVNAPPEERQVGGLGIYFMRQLMDSINYERLDGHNILTLRKHISQPSPL